LGEPRGVLERLHGGTLIENALVHWAGHRAGSNAVSISSPSVWIGPAACGWARTGWARDEARRYHTRQQHRCEPCIAARGIEM